MKIRLHTLVILCVALGLASCAAPEGNSNALSSSIKPASGPAGFTQPLTSSNGNGTVTIREGSRILSTCRTAAPIVEETRWYREQEQIAVKSRGKHGPATVQLFDSRTGAEVGRVMAYEIKNGKPAWATTMAE